VSPPAPLSISYGHVGCLKARAFPPPVRAQVLLSFSLSLSTTHFVPLHQPVKMHVPSVVARHHVVLRRGGASRVRPREDGQRRVLEVRQPAHLLASPSEILASPGEMLASPGEILASLTTSSECRSYRRRLRLNVAATSLFCRLPSPHHTHKVDESTWSTYTTGSADTMMQPSQQEVFRRAHLSGHDAHVGDPRVAAAQRAHVVQVLAAPPGSGVSTGSYTSTGIFNTVLTIQQGFEKSPYDSAGIVPKEGG
jgi:hypothetical protein